MGLIFSDPPYFSKFSDDALNTLSRLNAFKSNAIAVLETSYKEPIPKVEGFKVCESRKVGKTKIHFLKYN